MKQAYLAILSIFYLLAGVAVCAALALILSCSTISQKIDEKLYYKRTLKLRVNGISGAGVMVVPKAREYRIELDAENDMNFMRINTCHRAIEKEDVGDSFSFVFSPTPGLEDGGNCPITVEGYNKDGKHSLGFIAIESDDSTLPALVKCNGETKQSRGTSVCQSLAGLTQELSFSEPVEVPNSSDPLCKLDYKISGNSLTYNIPPRACVFSIYGQSSRWHRLFTHGYQNAVREKD